MTRANPVIAIDGPVSSGKSTAARSLADALGFVYLSTGAMYRAVAVKAREAGIDPDGTDLESKLQRILDSIRIEFDGPRVILDGNDISSEITEPAIGDLASSSAALGVVRARMRDLQRAAGDHGGVVMEGRDIGTAMFPDAEFKFFSMRTSRLRQRRYANSPPKAAEDNARGSARSAEGT